MMKKREPVANVKWTKSKANEPIQLFPSRCVQTSSSIPEVPWDAFPTHHGSWIGSREPSRPERFINTISTFLGTCIVKDSTSCIRIPILYWVLQHHNWLMINEMLLKHLDLRLNTFGSSLWHNVSTVHNTSECLSSMDYPFVVKATVELF